jgi:ribonuclease BN (tRNA processing enzyme)
MDGKSSIVHSQLVMVNLFFVENGARSFMSPISIAAHAKGQLTLWMGEPLKTLWRAKMEFDVYMENLEREMEYAIETAEKGIWITAEDEEIKIKDMKKDHIVNCLNMMQRNKNTFALELYEKQFLNELKRRHKESEDD